jgi:polyhydroxyalkanoate synthesis repressor PhaR
MREHRPPVLIKRFDGSRLYNTEAKTYVTLVDLSDLLVSGQRITVLEAETGEDITSEILDQLLAFNKSAGASHSNQ